MQDQKKEKKFVSGLYLSEGPAHLEWLPYKLGIKVDQFKEFLDQNKNEKGYVNIDIKIGQNSHYCELNDYKPNQTEQDQINQINVSDPQDLNEDLPF